MAPTYTPWSYSSEPDNLNTFSMTPANSPPAMLIWLFLTTRPKFLKTLACYAEQGNLAGIVFEDNDGVSMDLGGLSQLTNLTTDAILQIFKVYVGPFADAETAKNTMGAFGTVSALFSAYFSSVSNNYDPCECPGNTGLTQMGNYGVACDPMSLNKGSKEAPFRDALLLPIPRRKKVNPLINAHPQFMKVGDEE